LLLGLAPGGDLRVVLRAQGHDLGELVAFTSRGREVLGQSVFLGPGLPKVGQCRAKGAVGIWLVVRGRCVPAARCWRAECRSSSRPLAGLDEHREPVLHRRRDPDKGRPASQRQPGHPARSGVRSRVTRLVGRKTDLALRRTPRGNALECRNRIPLRTPGRRRAPA
jgi:hypothetical protein